MVEKKRMVDLYGPQTYERHSQYNWTTDPSPGVITKGTSLPIRALETLVSSGHGWYSTNRARGDVGGDFLHLSTTLSNFTPGTFYGERSFGNRYIGPAWPIDPYAAIRYSEQLAKPIDALAMGRLGTRAVAKCLPTNPVVDGATFLGELKAGVPKLIGKELLKTKFKDYRKYGSEYVNLEFGWKPIVSDLMKTAQAVTESEKILKQLERDSGKNIRRKYAFPEEASVTEGKIGGRYCYLPGGFSLPTYQYDGAGILTEHVEVKTRSWFSGCFTYHLNLGNTLPDKIGRQAAEARKLYGLELTPATVWNLAPWSWALDWEGSVGDAIHNVSRFSQDGLVMRYGYIMQEKTAKVTYTLHGGLPKQEGKSNGPVSMSVTTKSQQRYRATPFGFGFDMTALNGRQSAILGAIGISNGPRR
jgi:hypothetical protein